MIKKDLKATLLTAVFCLLLFAAAGCGKNNTGDTLTTQESIISPSGQPAKAASSGSTASESELPSANPEVGNDEDSASVSHVQNDSPDIQIIEDQTFSGITLGDYENVRFTTSKITQDGRDRVEYSLMSDGSVVYNFPSAYEYWYFMSEVNFIAFRDINGDGRKDVITSEQYVTGAGEKGAVPFSMTRIYLNQGSEFLFAEGLSVSIGNKLDASRPEEYTIENILTILEEPVYCSFGGADGWSKGEVESFAFLVKNDILNDNREALSKKISYPLNIVRNGEQLQITTPEEFISRYDDILNMQVIYDVEGAETEDLFWNQYGVMLGTGAIWFSRTTDGSLKIYSIPAEVQYCNPLDVE